MGATMNMGTCAPSLLTTKTWPRPRPGVGQGRTLEPTLQARPCRITASATPHRPELYTLLSRANLCTLGRRAASAGACRTGAAASVPGGGWSPPIPRLAGLIVIQVVAARQHNRMYQVRKLARQARSVHPARARRVPQALSSGAAPAVARRRAHAPDADDIADTAEVESWPSGDSRTVAGPTINRAALPGAGPVPLRGALHGRRAWRGSSAQTSSCTMRTPACIKRTKPARAGPGRAQHARVDSARLGERVVGEMQDGRDAAAGHLHAAQAGQPHGLQQRARRERAQVQHRRHVAQVAHHQHVVLRAAGAGQGHVGSGTGSAVYARRAVASRITAGRTSGLRRSPDLTARRTASGGAAVAGPPCTRPGRRLAPGD